MENQHKKKDRIRFIVLNEYRRYAGDRQIRIRVDTISSYAESTKSGPKSVVFTKDGCIEVLETCEDIDILVNGALDSESNKSVVFKLET